MDKNILTKEYRIKVVSSKAEHAKLLITILYILYLLYLYIGGIKFNLNAFCFYKLY